MSELWLILRIADVFLYGGVVSGFVMHWRTLHHDELPGFRWGLIGLFASLTYGVVELVFLQQPGGPRLIPITAFLAVLFVSCYLRTVQHLAERLKVARHG